MQRIRWDPLRESLVGWFEKTNGQTIRARLRKGVGRDGLRRALGIVVTVSMIASMVTMAVWPAATSASYGDALYNGGFEQGFSSQAGCGMVGSGWQCFTNGGAANYGFYDDQWDRTVAEGLHSQLIEVNTKGIMVGDADRYAGIYQTVPVVDWAEYTLSLSGMIRTTNLDGDPWRYRVQVGWSMGPTPNWGSVTNWTDVGWDKYYERTNPGSFLSYSGKLMAQADYVTIYVRVWKKWGVANEEIDVNLDAIGLYGPSPYAYAGPQHPPVAEPYAMEDWAPPALDAGYAAVALPVGGPVDAGYAMPPMPGGCATPCNVAPPLPPVVGMCAGPELVYNGGFEMGFNPVSVGHVGNSWGYFTNGGGANYGFYDDQWTPVVAEGKHSQLIEINTKSVYPADNDRYAGIYQYVAGLHAGTTYEFRMKGLLRGAGNEDDPYRFAAQVGYLPGYNADWQQVTGWTEMNLGPIAKRTEPGAMGEYTMKFVAPASDMTLFIRGWKKWGITNVEMDFNIDVVSVRGCLLYGTGGPVHPVHYEAIDPGYAMPPVDMGCGSGCDGGYAVDPGYTMPPVDTGCGSGCDAGYPLDPGYGVDPGYAMPVDMGCSSGCGGGGGGQCSYTVRPGDTLAWVAQSLGVSQYALIAANGIMNPDLIYVGQVLTNPACDHMGGGMGQTPYAADAGYGYAADYGAPAGGMGEGYGAGYGAEVPAGEGYGAGYGADAPAVEGYGAGYGADAPAVEGYGAGYGADAPAVEGYDGALAMGAPAYPAMGAAGWESPAAAMPMGGGSYTVQVGDNLSQVAAAYGVTVRQLMQANGIQNPNIIYVGQQLVMP